MRIGVAYPFQVRKLDCAERHDWKVDGIVTPTEVIWSEPIKIKGGYMYGFSGDWD